MGSWAEPHPRVPAVLPLIPAPQAAPYRAASAVGPSRIPAPESPGAGPTGPQRFPLPVIPAVIAAAVLVLARFDIAYLIFNSWRS